MKKIIVIFVVVAIMLGACTPKNDAGANTSTTKTSSITFDQIKDAAAWKAAYDTILDSYASAVTQLNGGNMAASTQIEEITKQADRLNEIAETIKAGLTGVEQINFAAMVDEYKQKFINTASSN